MDASDYGSPVTETDWPGAGQGWTVTGLLALGSIMSQFDRTVINLAVEPIKAAFDLDDTRFGMLQGVAFGIFYVLACVPIGRLADRYQRRLIIGAGLAVFSLMSMASGLARSYMQLFAIRVGVGVGEASLTPAGLSMLSDLFPPQRLGRPVSSFLMSAPVGQGLAFIIGGGLISMLASSPLLALPGLSGLAPWQAAFIIIGFPGLLLAPFFFLLREPARRGAGSARPLALREVMMILSRRRAALVPMFAGFAMVPVVSYAVTIWTPALLIRNFGWSPGEAGLGFGIVVILFGSTGAYFGGVLSDMLARRGHLDAPLKAAACGFVGCGLFGLLAMLMPSATLTLVFLAPTIFLSNTPYACAGTAIQLLTPNRARGQVTALYVTLTTLVGLGIGPLVVGFLTDHLFHRAADIRYSLAIVVGVAAPAMFGLMLCAYRPYRALRAAESGIGA